jgi:hypothetical protein
MRRLRLIERPFFEVLPAFTGFNPLRTCKVKGISSSQDALLTFLRNTTTLEHLELDTCELLPGGTYREVFDHLREMENLVSYRFFQLHERNMIGFRLSDGEESLELFRQGPDVSDRIDYFRAGFPFVKTFEYERAARLGRLERLPR